MTVYCALSFLIGAHMIPDYLVKVGGGERILRMRELSRRLQLSPSRLYALIAEGKFLKPFQLVPGGRAVGWLEREIDAWLLAQRMDGSSHRQERDIVGGRDD
jgi:prophage regulatory protein